MKGEVDASVGHVVEHDNKISGRNNCMEILCRRIDKHDHISRSNTLEVLMLSAVYASQRAEWRDAFLSLKDAEMNTNAQSKVPAVPDQNLSNPVVERQAAQLRSMVAALEQARSLNKPHTRMNLDPPEPSTHNCSSEIHSQSTPHESASNSVQSDNMASIDEIDSTEAPNFSNAQDNVLNGSCSFERVLNLDSMLDDADDGMEVVPETSPPNSILNQRTEFLSLRASAPPAEVIPAAVATPSLLVMERRSTSPGRCHHLLNESLSVIRDSSIEQIDTATQRDPMPPEEITLSVITPQQDLQQPVYNRRKSVAAVETRTSSYTNAELRAKHGIAKDEKIGYLFKRGRGRSISFLKPWSYRWCTLNVNTGRFSYHTEDNGYDVTYEKLDVSVSISKFLCIHVFSERTWKGAVDLSNGTVFELDGKLVGKQFAFDIACMSGDSDGRGPASETMTMAALYKSELDDWLYALSLVPGCEIVRLDSNTIIGDLFYTDKSSVTSVIRFVRTPFPDAEAESAARSLTSSRRPVEQNIPNPSHFESDLSYDTTFIEGGNNDEIESFRAQDGTATCTKESPGALIENLSNSEPVDAAVDEFAEVPSVGADTDNTSTHEDHPPDNVIVEGVVSNGNLTVLAADENIGNADTEVFDKPVDAFPDMSMTMPLPSFNSSPCSSRNGNDSDAEHNDWWFFSPETMDSVRDEDDETLWMNASAEALVEIITEENACLKRENKQLKKELRKKDSVNDSLRQKIAQLSVYYEEEMKSRELMSDAQVAAAADLVSELQTKLFSTQEELAQTKQIQKKCYNTNAAVNEAADAKEKEKSAELEAEMAMQKNVLSLMSTDVEEPLPLLPLKLWNRKEILSTVIDSVMSADRWKTPLVFLNDALDRNINATSGKTTLASMACRSAEIREKFHDNIFWLHVGQYESMYSNVNGQNDCDHCPLLEVLADKIRKRLCPWLVRKIRKPMMTARDWRLYISDLLHSTKHKSSSSTHLNSRSNTDFDQLSESEGQYSSLFRHFLLVLDDVKHPSVVSSLGFLGMVTVVTSRTCWNYQNFGTSIEVMCPTTSDILGFPSGNDNAPRLHLPPRSFGSFDSASKNAENKSVDENTTLSGLTEQNLCALKSAISGNIVPQSPAIGRYTALAQEQKSFTWQHGRDIESSKISKISGNLSSAFIKLSQEDQYRLISLSFLPAETVFPYSLVAALWETDFEKGRHYLFSLFSGAWVGLTSPGDGFSVHKVCSDFLAVQLERLPLVARRHLKDKSLEAAVSWLVSADAFDNALLRYGYDWSYIVLWAHMNNHEALGKYQEQFMISSKNMKYLISSDRLTVLYFIDYAASVVLRVPCEDDDNKAWCEDWIRKSLQLKMELLSEKTLGSDLYVFRDICPFLLDCNTKHMIYADTISYLQHTASYQRSMDVKAGKASFASAELLVFQGAFHSAAGRLHRAGDMYKEAEIILRDRLTAPGTASFLDSICLTQVLYKLKQQGTDSQALDISGDDYNLVNEMLDEVMSGRKVYLGCEEHPRLTDIIQLSGEAWARTENGDAMSRKLFKAALMMRCLQLGEAHPSSIKLFEQMALSLEAIGKPLSSLPYLQKISELAKKSYGSVHPYSIFSFIELCCTLRGLSREEEAATILKKLLYKVRQLTIDIEQSAPSGANDISTVDGGQNNADNCLPPSFYGLLVLGYAHICMSTTCPEMKKDIPKVRKLLLEVLKLMHNRRVGSLTGANEQEDAITASVLFKLGAISEDIGDFNRAKKYYSSASTSFAEVGDKYHLCSILSLVRLSACEVNLGELEDSRLLLEAAHEALEDVTLNGIPNSFPGVLRQGVFAVADITHDSRFYCLLFRVMEWLGLVLPNAASDMNVAVDKLLQVAMQNN